MAACKSRQATSLGGSERPSSSSAVATKATRLVFGQQRVDMFGPHGKACFLPGLPGRRDLVIRDKDVGPAFVMRLFQHLFLAGVVAGQRPAPELGQEDCDFWIRRHAFDRMPLLVLLHQRRHLAAFLHDELARHADHEQLGSAIIGRHHHESAAGGNHDEWFAAHANLIHHIGKQHAGRIVRIIPRAEEQPGRDLFEVGDGRVAQIFGGGGERRDEADAPICKHGIGKSHHRTLGVVGEHDHRIGAEGLGGRQVGAVGFSQITSGTFTVDARLFAEGRNVQLLDGAFLARMIRTETPPAPTLPGRGTVSSPEINRTVPHCPVCGVQMVQRVAQRGVTIGQRFWGCSGYPKCRGTLPD